MGVIFKMPKSDPQKLAYRQAIENLRNKYSAEIEKSLQTLMTLRDTAEKDKDKIEAAKQLALLLGVRKSEERTSANVEREKVKEQEDKFELSPEYRARLDALLGKK